jgi:hypothetical protein
MSWCGAWFSNDGLSFWTWIFSKKKIPLAMLKPLFSSSLYSWHRAQLSQQKWTQQSMQGDSCKLYCDRIAERLVQEYNQLQPMHPRQT